MNLSSSSLHLGPLALPLSLLLLFLCLAIGWGMAQRAARRQGLNAEPALWNLLLAGLVAARLAFVWEYRADYAGSPLQMIDIRDGGWTPWVGFLVAGVLVLLRRGPRRALQRPLVLGVLCAGLLWGVGDQALQSLARPAGTVGLPTAPLQSLATATTPAQPLSLQDFANGRPTVVNLWASWCPPCRREMPVLAAAQQAHADVDFVFVNQGESAAAVQAYLARDDLGLRHVLLDTELAIGRAFGQRALPATLFFDAKGMLVATRVGELSQATLSQYLNRLQRAEPAGASTPAPPPAPAAIQPIGADRAQALRPTTAG